MQRHVESTARNRKISLQKNEGFIFGVNSTVSILTSILKGRDFLNIIS